MGKIRLGLFQKPAERIGDEEQKQRAHSLQGLSNLLYQAGFDRVIVYGNGRMEAPRENEQRWHFAAIRRLDPDGASEGEKNI